MFSKVTHGCVVQQFDDSGKFLGQEFIAGDYCEYEGENKTPITQPTTAQLNAYEPFDMIQPAGY
jgi:hypothetical protein